MRRISAARIAVGGIVHETNAFAPTQTGLEAFARQSFHVGSDLLNQLQGTPTPIGGMLRGLVAFGAQVVPTLYAAAMPSGLVTRETYDALLTQLLDALRAALPLDGILLALHGAMAAVGQDDCEGEILEQVRSLVGPNCPVVATLDMHANVSPKMVEAAHLLVAYNTNPHVDAAERGAEAAQLIHRLLKEDLRPTTTLVRPPLLLSALATRTERPPLRPAHQRACVMRKDPRVIVVSLLGGFAYVDTPFTGMSVVVSTNGAPELAQSLAQELAQIAWDNREVANETGLSVGEAVRRALAAPRGPVILADVGDNIGGGSSGDGTFLLAELHKAGAQDAVVVLADPQAVDQAVCAGVDATVEMAVGGKTDAWHGEPEWVRAEVECLTDGRFAVNPHDHFAAFYGREVNMGRCAVLRWEGIRILLTERKTPPGDLAQLRSQGIVPEAQRIIVVKSPVAFRAAYESIAAEILVVDTPGLCTANLTRFRYTKLSRPVFPLDQNFNWAAH